MKISELTFIVDHCGGLKIPTSVLREMGLAEGDHVRMAYLTHDGVTNTFLEFMLLPDTIDSPATNERNAIHIPMQIMQQSGIPQDADLQIACLNGCIVICQDPGLQTKELLSVLEALQTAEHVTNGLPGDTHQALQQLGQAIRTIQEGAEADE